MMMVFNNDNEYANLPPDTIPIMNLLKELQQCQFHIISTQSTTQSTVFEDNNGAIEIVNVPKMRPFTKHINLVYQLCQARFSCKHPSQQQTHSHHN